MMAVSAAALAWFETPLIRGRTRAARIARTATTTTNSMSVSPRRRILDKLCMKKTPRRNERQSAHEKIRSLGHEFDPEHYSLSRVEEEARRVRRLVMQEGVLTTAR